MAGLQRQLVVQVQDFIHQLHVPHRVIALNPDGPALEPGGVDRLGAGCHDLGRLLLNVEDHRGVLDLPGVDDLDLGADGVQVDAEGLCRHGPGLQPALDVKLEPAGNIASYLRLGLQQGDLNAAPVGLPELLQHPGPQAVLVGQLGPHLEVLPHRGLVAQNLPPS